MYDGSRFKGWQDNGIEGTNLNTVQAILKLKLSERLATPINAVGASRTDAGVHARGQVIHFDTPSPITDIPKFEYTINRLLPDDIRMFNVSLSPGGSPSDTVKRDLFHATKYATGKYYSYTLCTNKIVDPMLRRYCGHVYFPVDMSVFRLCLNLFVGTHDFAAFAHKVEYRRREFESRNFEFSSIKTIHSAELVELPHYGPGYYRVDIRLNSALYHMVRNVVGTCAYAAAGRMSLTDVQTMLGPSILSTLDTACNSEYPDDDEEELTAPYERRVADDRDFQSIISDKTRMSSEKSADMMARAMRSPHLARPAPPEGLCLEHVYYDDY